MGEVYVITSGKGGAGKSTVTVGLGYALADRGLSTLLIDGDAGLKSLDMMLGLEDEIVYNLADVFSGECEPIKAIYPCAHQEKLFLLPAPQSLDELSAPEDFRRLVGGFARHFDYVLIDCSAGIGKGFDCAVEAADKAILVSTPDLICARNAYIVSDILEERKMPVRLLINRLRSKLIQTDQMPDVDEIIDAVSVQLIGIILEEESVSVSTANGRMFPIKSAATECFWNVAGRIIGEEIPLSI